MDSPDEVERLAEPETLGKILSGALDDNAKPSRTFAERQAQLDRQRAEHAKLVAEANDHWLNQKALDLLQTHGEVPLPETQHVLTLLWGIAQHPPSDLNPHFPLEELVTELMDIDLNPGKVLDALIGKSEEGDDQQIREHHMDEVNSPLEMFDLLRGTLSDLTVD